MDQNVQVLLSYFYQVRFMDPQKHVPLSTAIWSPKWFAHPQKGDVNLPHLDKRGVILGSKALKLVPGNQLNGLCQGRKGHGSVCNGNPDHCEFLKQYENQLQKMDLKQYIQNMQELVNRLQKQFHPEADMEAVPVLMFWEDPNNQCSERQVVAKMLDQLGVKFAEFQHQ